MKVWIFSVNNHRINEITAARLSEVLTANGIDNEHITTTAQNYDNEDLVFLVNGTKSEYIHRFMAMLINLKVYYFLDELSSHIPDEVDVVVSQFRDRGDVHFPIAELHYLGDKVVSNKLYNFVYWGHFKPEREKYYVECIPNKSSTLIIGEVEDWRRILPNCTYLPYTRNMDNLYDLISKGKKTSVFGDDKHNGVNIPARVYEALRCGIEVKIHEDLLGNQSVDYNPTISSIFNNLCLAVKEIAPDVDQNDVDSVLAQRGAIYGSYSSGVDCRGKMLLALSEKYAETHNGEPMPANLVVMFSDINLKLMRIASDPTHLDSFVDLAGYAKIIKEAQVDGK